TECQAKASHQTLVPQAILTTDSQLALLFRVAVADRAQWDQTDQLDQFHTVVQTFQSAVVEPHKEEDQLKVVQPNKVLQPPVRSHQLALSIFRLFKPLHQCNRSN